MTSFIYAKMFEKAFLEEISLLADANKVALTSSSYTPAQDTHDYYAALTNELANGNGYTTGGTAIVNDTFGYTAGTNTWMYDADDTSWSSATFTARYGVPYDSTPTNKPLFTYQDFGGDFSVSAGTFTISWNAAGIWTVTVA